MQTRWKSKVLWAAIAAQIISLLVTLGVIDTGLGEAMNALVASVCEVLVLVGVLNNPTSGSTF